LYHIEAGSVPHPSELKPELATGSETVSKNAFAHWKLQDFVASDPF
jgi:hypothetical protein